VATSQLHATRLQPRLSKFKNCISLLHQTEQLSQMQLHEVPEESGFLLEVDTNLLAIGHTEEQEYWVCAMEAARQACHFPASSSHTASLQIGPPMSVGGVFSLLEEIRHEWRDVRIPRKQMSPAYPVRSEGYAAALLDSNRRRKTD
jgi:hypothetical protein